MGNSLMNLKLHSLMRHSHTDSREARDDDRVGSCACFKFTVSEVEVISCSNVVIKSKKQNNNNKKTHFNQKQLTGVRDLFGLYFWVRVYYWGMLCHELKHDLGAEIIEECCLVAGLVAGSCSDSFPVQSRLTFPGNAAAHSDLGSSKSINNRYNLPQICSQANQRYSFNCDFIFRWLYAVSS